MQEYKTPQNIKFWLTTFIKMPDTLLRVSKILIDHNPITKTKLPEISHSDNNTKLTVTFPNIEKKPPSSEYFTLVRKNFIKLVLKFTPNINIKVFIYCLDELLRNFHQHGWRYIKLSCEENIIFFEINPKIKDGENINDILGKINEKILFMEYISNDPDPAKQVAFMLQNMNKGNWNDDQNSGMWYYTSKKMFNESGWDFDIQRIPNNENCFLLTIKKILI